MKYEAPRISDLGSIAEHTFANAGGGVTAGGSGMVPPKDTAVCKLDRFGEYSCGS
jgi:hypothetical protein